MVKVLISLDDRIYKKLIEISLNRFGHPRGISKIINKVLEKFLAKRKELKYSIKLGRKTDLSPEKIEKYAEEAWYESYS